LIKENFTLVMDAGRGDEEYLSILTADEATSQQATEYQK
jgi:hypothetical protein